MGLYSHHTRTKVFMENRIFQPGRCTFVLLCLFKLKVYFVKRTLEKGSMKTTFLLTVSCFDAKLRMILTT